MLDLNQKLETGHFKLHFKRIDERATVFSYGIKGCLAGVFRLKHYINRKAF